MSETEDTEQREKEMMSMFASVWVKVEVEEEDDSVVENPLEVSTNIVNTAQQENKGKTSRRFSKILKCKECEYTTVYKNCLELHYSGHNNVKPYSCNYCNYTTKYPTSLQRHVLIQHEFKKSDHDNEVPEHKCDLCPYATFFKWNLNAHRRKHKLEKQFKCDKCSFETAFRHNLMKHTKVHNNQQVIFKCDKCPFVTRFEGHITRHLAKIHNEISDTANKCDVCDFSTKARWRLKMHKQRSKQDNLIKCPRCQFETYYMCEYKKHKVVHYNEIYGSKNTEYMANIDSNIIENSENIKMKPKTNENNDDSMELVDRESLPSPSMDSKQTIHEKTNHYTLDSSCEIDIKSIQVIESKSKDQPFQCIMCNYTSRFKASVQRHFQRHHTGSQNRPYKCCNCDFSTKTKDQIALHNKRSRSEIQLTCTECTFTTFFKCQHVMHQKCHYPHKCHLCDYSCKQKYEIQKHFTVAHLGDGIKCRFCDYKASRKESLLCHETIHTGVKPFKCLSCDYTSVRKSLLDNHIKRNHSVIRKDVVIVSKSKIESLKIPVGGLKNQNIIQDLREQNLTIEDLLSSQGTNVFDEMIKCAQKSNPELL